MAKATPVFMDSFHYDYADILKKWTALSGQVMQNPGIGSLYGRVRGERGFGTTNAGGDMRGYYRTLPGSYQTVVFGGWYYHSATAPASNTFLAAGQGATVGIGIRGDGAGRIVIYRATSAVATSTLTISTGWHFYEVKAFINGTTGSYDVAVDGTSYLTGTGANTGTSAITSLIFNFPNSMLFSCTGLYLCDATVSGKQDMLGPQICYPRLPSEAGTTTDWAGNFGPNYSNVNDIPPDGDMTFNHSSTAGHIDTFGGSDLPGSGAISGIQHVIWARTDGSSHTIRPAQRISGTTYHAMTAQAVGATYSALLFPTAVSPVDGTSAFTDSVINDSENGYELVT